MTAVPAEIPETFPETGSTDIVVLTVLHVPPVIASLNATVEPGQTADNPKMAAGVRLTVKIIDALHPVLRA